MVIILLLEQSEAIWRKPWNLYDVSMGGLFDPNNNSPIKQEFKAKNWLFKAPRSVGKAEASPGLLFIFDPGKGQLG